MQPTTLNTAPALSVDAVIFRLNDYVLEVLLIKRPYAPFADQWALPGGYSAAGITTRQALRSALIEKLNIDISSEIPQMEQLYTFDSLARDPREHTVSVVYMGCGRDLPVQEGDNAAFFDTTALPELAFDHTEIVNYGRDRLKAKLGYTNAVYGLLPEKFTLSQLQNTYEAVLSRPLDKRNFRKKFLSLNLIHETDETWRDGAHRPAKLYSFNSKTLESLARSFG